MLTTTDHKKLGIMYIIMSFSFFFVGGLMALLIRAELFQPGLQFLSNEQFNQLFTMHGTVMLLLFGTPIVWGFANYILPLQIGAPDVAFPRLNAFGFWLTTIGGILMLSGFLTPGGAADFGWTMYSRCRTPSTPGRRFRPVDRRRRRRRRGHHRLRHQHDHHGPVPPCAGHDHVPHADLHLEHPGDLDPGLLIFPILTAAALGVLYDRKLGGHIYDPANGGAIMWQHLFWFFGHPRSTCCCCRSSASSPRSSGVLP